MACSIWAHPGQVVALDSANGKLLWAYELPGGDQPPFAACHCFGDANGRASSSAAPKAS
jgi:hypothetical protein